GMVQEWYATVTDREKVEAAKILVGCLRKLEFLGTDGTELRRLEPGLSWVRHEVKGFKAQAAALETALGTAVQPSRTLLSRVLRRSDVFGALREADQRLQVTLHRFGWLPAYQRVRVRLKRLL